MSKCLPETWMRAEAWKCPAETAVVSGDRMEDSLVQSDSQYIYKSWYQSCYSASLM